MSLLRRLLNLFRGLAPRTRPLCDNCRYDYGDACTRPERPNALQVDAAPTGLVTHPYNPDF